MVFTGHTIDKYTVSILYAIQMRNSKIHALLINRGDRRNRSAFWVVKRLLATTSCPGDQCRSVILIG